MPVLFDADDDHPNKKPSTSDSSPNPEKKTVSSPTPNTDEGSADFLFPESQQKVPTQQKSSSHSDTKESQISSTNNKEKKGLANIVSNVKTTAHNKIKKTMSQPEAGPENVSHPERAAVHLVEEKHLPLPHKPSTDLLGAFITAPKKVFFATQGPGEIIILYLRQHPITQIPRILLTIILVIAPPFLFPLLGIFFPFELPLSYQLVFTILWYMVVFAYVYVSFILWYYNVNLVTNMRIVDIDFVYLLTQEVSATRIAQVEDVTYQRIGVWATIFNYGNVLIQTAGTEANIEFLRVPDPKRIAQTIIRLMGSVPTTNQ